MPTLNVRQPKGGTALFSTISDRFMAFNASPRGGAAYMGWGDALDYSIGAVMAIGPDVKEAIALGLVSEAKCNAILARHEAEWEEDERQDALSSGAESDRPRHEPER